MPRSSSPPTTPDAIVQLCLFEDQHVRHLLPLVHTRAVYGLRLGARTLLAATRDAFDANGLLLHARPAVAAVTREEHGATVNRLPDGLDVLFVNGRYVAEEGDVLERLRSASRSGEPARVFTQGDDIVAAWIPNAGTPLSGGELLGPSTFEDVPTEEVDGATLIGRLWHLLDGLDDAIIRDYQHATGGYNVLEHGGADVHESAVLLEPDHIYLGAGAQVLPGAVLNASSGPIFIDEGATIMEHAVVRGPAYVGPHSIIKVAADVSESTIGPWCKVAGEVEGSVIHSYSNKAHPGFLGDSYLGRWCNLGADTNTSNLKNDYGEVTLYDAVDDAFVGTGRQFAGLFMGDHSKCGINTMFNTGTVIGVYCNVFGAGFPPRHLPSFSWGSPDGGFTTYRLEKALRVAEAVMARRDWQMTDADRALLRDVFERTRPERS